MSPKRSAWPVGGRLAFLLSLVMHAGLAALLFTLAGRSQPPPLPGSPLLDAVTVANEENLPLSIVKEPNPPRKERTRKRLGPVTARPTRAGNLAPAESISVGPQTNSTLPSHEEMHPAMQASGKSGVADRGSSAGQSGGGVPGETTRFFSIPATGQSIVYVLDRSASMGPVGGGPSGLDVARRQLLASLELLPATARFQVITYNLSAETLCIASSTGLVFATLDCKQEAGRQLEMLSAEGQTNHMPALTRALSLRPDVIFFLTDADDLTVEQAAQVTRINALQNAGRTVIHTIELTTAHRGRSEMPLQLLARSNHGTYQAVSLEDEQ
jgi:hypothetical protein